MEAVFSGNRIITTDDNELRALVNKYGINVYFSNWAVKNNDEFIDYCIERKKQCIYKTYFIEFNHDNSKIKWIGLNEENDTYGPVTLYDNTNLKRSVLKDVITFSEATNIWGLGESTLRSTVRTERLVEGVDYRKSGKVWLITKEAMTKIYGEPKK